MLSVADLLNELPGVLSSDMSNYKYAGHMCHACMADTACRREELFYDTDAVYPEICIGCFQRGWNIWNYGWFFLQIKSDEFFWSYFG